MTIRTLDAPPGSNLELRRRIYDGQIIILRGNAAALSMVALVRELVVSHFGEDFRNAQFTMSREDFLAKLGEVRKLIAGDPYNAALLAVLTDLGFTAPDLAYDQLRMRAVMHEGHTNPKAAPVYNAHRDCWYGNPQCQLNWWTPLHDVGVDETFVFFPQYFRVAVKNDSSDYDAWVARVGWQNTTGVQAVYPTVESQRIDPAQGIPFACRAGDLLIFSASHLHQTTQNESGKTRFSLDFRTVHTGDHAIGFGAPNVDNSSTGSALQDYARPSVS
jgi:hypothetical protein